MKAQFNAALSAGWCIALCSLIGAVGWAAETAEIRPTPAKTATNAQRFLFIVETSSDNRKYEDANRQAVFDLVVGGVNNQMRPGDTFGIWTFSDDVRTGEFPVTLWDPELALEIGSQVATFLEKQHYSKNPDIKPVIGQLRLLANRVADFNVFIVSTGREKIEGTPYDQKINAAYTAYAKRPGKLARIPLVTSFVVHHARPTRPSVVLAGEPISLPPRPALPPTTRTNNLTSPNSTAAALAAQVPTSARRTGETAISIGNTSAVAEASVPRKKVIQFVTHTNSPDATKSNIPGTTGTVAASASNEGNAPESDSASAAATVRPPAPAQATITQSPTPANPSSNVPVVAAIETAARDLTASALTATPSSSAPASPAPPAPTSASAPLKERVPEQTPPQAPESKPGFSVTSVSTILSAAAQALTPAPLPVAAREPETAKSDASPDTFVVAATAVSSAPVTMATIPAVSQTQLGAGALIAMGGTLLGATAFLLVVVLRRAPRPARGSLISQSMHRQ